ncbi:MAG: enoyl-CoA hydratase/isomerase family protein [Chloroflexota bacterium]|nr:enoyl-CoA hydratase/isomerase family protein [Chloroflexota bacterium]
MITDTRFHTVIYSKNGPVATVSLNRPEVVNAYSVKMRDELFQVLRAIHIDEEVKVIVVTGKGTKGFCAGADLTEFETAPSQIIARQARWNRDIWGVFRNLDKPIVGALHGWVIGLGVEIACFCDIRIASEDTLFSLPEVALGMIPAAGGTQTIPRSIGGSRALRMILTNQQIDAITALDMGLIHKIVTGEVLLAEAYRIAQDLVAKDEAVLALSKKSIKEGMDLPLNLALSHERRLLSKLVSIRLFNRD